MKTRPFAALASTATWIVVVAMTAGCSRQSLKAPAPAAPTSATATPRATDAPIAPGRTAASAPATEELAPVYFAYDSFTLSEEARLGLDRNARVLRARPDLRLLIEGHCDERGTTEYNQALGERRALAAREYLVASGIPSSRIETVSLGKERPFEEGHDERSWASNRRAQLLAR